MRRSLAERLLLACGLVVVTGALGACTLVPGAPWAELEDASLEVTFAPATLDDGRVVAGPAYALVIDDVRLTVEGVSLLVTALEGPASGHSHEHAHEDEGEPEDEHEDEAALVLEGGALELTVGSTPATLSLAGCDGGCTLPRGELTELELTLSSLELSGTVYDRRTGPAAQLPDEGAPLFARVAGAVPLHAPLALPLDGDATTHVSLAAQLTLPKAPFASVDFATLPRDADGALILDEAAVSAVLTALGESELTVSAESDHDHEHEGEHEHEHEEGEAE